MVKAIVGANWGDEGKGKITDVLANDSDIVIRFQGGANAGHTIVNDYGKFALHQLPSGVFHQNITNIIGNGVAFSVENFVKEMAHLKDRGVPEPNIIISDRAQIVMPYHVAFDCYEEERLGKNSFGSTKSGIAPFYSDKYSKIGFQINELYDDPDSLREKIRHALEIKNATLKNLYNKPEITEQEVFDKLMEYKELLAPYVGDAFTFVHNALKDGKNILLEGQLGSLKDTDFGIYPMVTSSNTIAGYGAVGAGIPPYEIKEIITVVKAYSSAVGAGEFVSEIFGEEADELRRRGGDGGEFGVCGGRPAALAALGFLGVGVAGRGERLLVDARLPHQHRGLGLPHLFFPWVGVHEPGLVVRDGLPFLARGAAHGGSRVDSHLADAGAHPVARSLARALAFVCRAGRDDRLAAHFLHRGELAACGPARPVQSRPAPAVRLQRREQPAQFRDRCVRHLLAGGVAEPGVAPPDLRDSQDLCLGCVGAMDAGRGVPESLFAAAGEGHDLPQHQHDPADAWGRNGRLLDGVSNLGLGGEECADHPLGARAAAAASPERGGADPRMGVWRPIQTTAVASACFMDRAARGGRRIQNLVVRCIFRECRTQT